MNRLLLTGLILYVILLAIVYFNQHEMLYHPHKPTHELAFYNIDNAREIFLTTKDNVKLQVWYREPNKDQDMVIFLHGNAGNLEDRADKLTQLAKMGYGFIIPAWRGFGKSEGFPSKEGLFNDAECVINYLKQENYKLNKNVIIIGESLGTGIATEMAVRHKFKGLFLITPYTSIADRAGELYPYLPTQFLTIDNFKVLANITKINQPLFIIHGTADNVIPYQHAEKIFAKANDPKKIIIYPGINHSNYNIEKVFEAMKEFFNQKYI